MPVPNNPVLSYCKLVYGYPPDFEVCKGKMLADGTMHSTCGDPCSFVMMKSGVGDPPFNWKRKKFVGDVEVPDQPVGAGMKAMTDELRIEAALEIAFSYSQIDGEHHKAWVIDQMVRALTGDKYEEFVADHNAGTDGPNTYSWDTGIAP